MPRSDRPRIRTGARWSSPADHRREDGLGAVEEVVRPRVCCGQKRLSPSVEHAQGDEGVEEIAERSGDAGPAARGQGLVEAGSDRGASSVKSPASTAPRKTTSDPRSPRPTCRICSGDGCSLTVTLPDSGRMPASTGELPTPTDGTDHVRPHAELGKTDGSATGGRIAYVSALHVDVTRRLHRGSERQHRLFAVDLS